MQANTTYTETTLNVDHYWNIGTDEDGRHKQVQMPKTQSGGSPSDITLGTGMDGGMYLKETSYGRVEGFYRNTNGIYQFIPSFYSGTAVLNTSTYANIVELPDSCYGTIYLFKTGTGDDGQFGWFKNSGGVCRAYSSLTQKTSSSSNVFNAKLNTNGAQGLFIQARAESGGAGTYEYRIMLWDI